MSDAPTPFYELIVLGAVTDAERTTLAKRVAEIAAEFQLDFGTEIVLRDASDCEARNRDASTTALYFGGDPTRDQSLIDALEIDKMPIVPVVRAGEKPEDVLPATIAALNAVFLDADDTELEAPFAIALECLGLLHRQRRIFISYRRTESREVAVQLHDELSGRGFDVFLDTHDIRPGTVFQEMLWHRLVDCDVVVMLDTPDYFSSKWTSLELGRSQSKGIQLLRLVWPDHKPTRKLGLSDTIMLEAGDLTAQRQLTGEMIDTVARRAERVRSRSIATRQLSLAGKLAMEIKAIGGTIEGIGAYRAMAINLPNGLKLHAYPMVGVPTAELLNEIETKAQRAKHSRFPCLVFDDVGIRPAWREHLAWLDKKIKDVRCLKVHDAGWELVGWDNQ
ncbi:toll/interleukin-1 receptor domain-containing protein [Novosphingobium aerophilum]|uniref:toll/interleukin-1 receptor domain-containing protein n=1 Tax=Novosphingobium aerophilum TaxID=2839843 RepID=UPI003FD0E0FF